MFGRPFLFWPMRRSKLYALSNYPGTSKGPFCRLLSSQKGAVWVSLLVFGRMELGVMHDMPSLTSMPVFGSAGGVGDTNIPSLNYSKLHRVHQGM